MIGRAASPSEKTARGNIIPQAREVLPRMRDQHDLAGRGDLHVPQNPDGASLNRSRKLSRCHVIGAPSMFPLFGKAD